MTQTTEATPTTGTAGTPSSSTDTPATANPTGVVETLDRLSLEQALIDVEVANARVIDLTARLTESHIEAQQLRQQVLELSGSAPSESPQGLRTLVAGPLKAVARRILPMSVRTRLRSALG